MSSTGYYVYALLRHHDSSPFYIGKGKGNRVRVHAKLSRHDKNEHKKRIIANEIAEYGSLLWEIIASGLTEVDAFPKIGDVALVRC